MWANLPVGARGSELEEVVSSGAALQPLVDATNGTVQRMREGTPMVRRVAAGRPASGGNWIALPRRDACRVASAELRSLMPPWLALALILAALAASWFWESGMPARRWAGIANRGD